MVETIIMIKIEKIHNNISLIEMTKWFSIFQTKLSNKQYLYNFSPKLNYS